MQFKIIETNRLLLRKITPEVHQYVHSNFSADEIKSFFAITTEKAYEREMRMAAGGLTTYNKSFVWFHLLDKKTNRHIGWCGYHLWNTDHARAEIGYGLYDDNYKEKGLMTEALQTVLTFGFDEMKLNRIEALTATYNIPSIKLLEKFGFKKEGVLRGHYLVDGVYEDSVMFGLLEAEYQQ